MKKYITIFCFCITLIGCITEYNAPNVIGIKGMLVVEGIITDYETTILLSRAVNLSEDYIHRVTVNGAAVYVETDEGTQWRAVNLNVGRYTIKMGKLNPERKYRLRIEIEEDDHDCNPEQNSDVPCPKKIYKYFSEFSYPIQSPEIDSLFWLKRDKGQPVNIYISTQSQNNEVLYYRWSYKEDWEVHADYYWPPYPYYCWGTENSTEILLGNTRQTIDGQLTEKLTEVSPFDMKFSELYRITVKQHGISKQAYDFFSNIKKNVEQIGTIFAPIPTEIRGNIYCSEDPDLPVIGYVEVTTTTEKHLFISSLDVYEGKFPYDCQIKSEDEVGSLADYIEIIPSMGPNMPALYIYKKCIDCRYFGSPGKPADWPPIIIIN